MHLGDKVYEVSHYMIQTRSVQLVAQTELVNALWINDIRAVVWVGCLSLILAKLVRWKVNLYLCQQNSTRIFLT